MAKHRSYPIEFKRQVAQEYLAGETFHGLAKRHEINRNLVRIWVAKYEAGSFDSDAAGVRTQGASIRPVRRHRGGVSDGVRHVRGRGGLIAALHRRGLQRQAAPLRTRISEPRHVRTGARPADGQIPSLTLSTRRGALHC